MAMNDEIYADSPSNTRLRFRRWSLDDVQFILKMYSLKEVYQYLGSSPAPLEDVSKAEAAVKRWNVRTVGAQDSGRWCRNRVLTPIPR